jgi:hypothetical protein
MSRFPYSSTVRILMYVMVCTRPDIAHGVVVVSRYMNNPGILEVLLLMGYVLEVQTLLYSDMLIKSWHVLNITVGAPHGMFLL